MRPLGLLPGQPAPPHRVLALAENTFGLCVTPAPDGEERSSGSLLPLSEQAEQPHRASDPALRRPGPPHARRQYKPSARQFTARHTAAPDPPRSTGRYGGRPPRACRPSSR